MKHLKLFGYSISLSKGAGKTANKAVSAQSDKKRATTAIKRKAKRNVSYEIKDITLAEQQALNTDVPDRSRLFEIYRYIKKDGHLKSQVKVAKFKVASEPWLLYKDGEPDMLQSELFNKTWFNKIIEYILETEFEAYSVVEMDELNPQECTASVTLIDRDYICIEKQYILVDGTINGDFIPYGDIAWDIDLLEFGNKTELGSFLECAYNVIWKYFSRNDWSRGSEKYAAPILSITADTNDDEELNDLEIRAANFGTDGYIIGQKGDEINIIERKGQRMHDIWMDNIKLCNDEVSKIINGNTATSEEKAFSGSAQVQERTMDDFTIARLQNVATQINDILCPYLAAKGFPIEGYRFDYPRLRRIREQRINGITATDPANDPANDPKAQ